MYKKEAHGLLKHIDFVILDMICLQIGFALSYIAVGYILVHSQETINPYATDMYRYMAVLIALVSLVMMFVTNSLQDVLKRRYYTEAFVTLQHSVYTLALSILLLYFSKAAEQYSRLIFGFTFVFYTAITYILRMLWKRRLLKEMRTGGEKSLLIIVEKAKVHTVIKNLKVKNYGRYLLSGIVLLDADEIGSKIDGVKVVANVDNAAMYVCQQWIDEVIIFPQEQVDYPKKMIDQLIETGVTVHINLAEIVNIPGKKQMVEEVADYTVLTTAMNYASPLQLFAKRLLDIAGGLVGCIITAILFVFVAPIIYINSPGPIFFAQERVGKNGKKFKMYKFRSMYMDAEERKKDLMAQNKISDGKMFKMDFDPRVIGNKVLPDGTKKTGIGQFIRDTSIDEFPQFFCVLTGNMSLVGTRPPLEGEVSLYELHHRSRLAIKPGITGMWQVSGRSEIVNFEEVVKLDQEYINNWNLGLDIKILFKTILVVLKREGSS